MADRAATAFKFMLLSFVGDDGWAARSCGLLYGWCET